MSPTPDDIDRKLLRLLQRDGRLSNSALAAKLKLSEATCHRRMQRLFEEGVVQSVRAQVNPQSVERDVIVVVGVVLDRSTPESFAALEAAVQKLPVVLDCYLVAGDFDYFLKVRVRDLQDFNRLHSKTLIALPGVRQIRTFFVLKEVIDDAPLEF
ncbi:MAG TPA: Lrp/AsnC family transcriptional regulator [Steroidobacteraceae bacterium]|nr:Lrp/AsnC family transcriptional regulator [Steroidobacteraceae bacterium]